MLAPLPSDSFQFSIGLIGCLISQNSQVTFSSMGEQWVLVFLEIYISESPMDSKIFLLRKIHKYSGNVRGSEVSKKSSMDSWLRSPILYDLLFPFISNAIPLLPVLL